jgi:hypothetical protein
LKPHRKRFLATALASVALAVISAPSLAEIPPEAQPAFNKGLLAAQQQEWDIALQSFQDARKLAPTSPEIYYNLGLTESKIPGRELRAIAWLAAYLAADPDAANASPVKTAILGLLIKNEGNIDRFIEVASKTAEQVPEGDLSLPAWARPERGAALDGILTLYFEEGDETKAASWQSEAHLDAASVASAREQATRTKNASPNITGALASDWLKELDEGNNQGGHGLSSAIFVDLSGYVASDIKTRTNPLILADSHDSAMFVSAMALERTASDLLTERRFVTQMLTKQFGPGFVP